jgi:hypothetical protein
MKYLSLGTRSGQLIRYMGNLKTIYALGSSTILSAGFGERVFCGELSLKDVKKGEFYSQPGQMGHEIRVTWSMFRSATRGSQER